MPIQRMSILILAGAVVYFSFAAASIAQSQPPPVLCNGQYALCTSAACVPDPLLPGKEAICSCEVRSGLNFGINSSCDDRRPRVVPASGKQSGDGDAGAGEETGQVVQLRSTYSFAQAPQKAVMLCPAGNPWTDCLDVKCTVDPANPLKAICACKMGHVEEPEADFVTYGGDCNTLTCQKYFWSAATTTAFEEGSLVMADALGLKESPVKFCPLVGNTPQLPPVQADE